MQNLTDLSEPMDEGNPGWARLATDNQVYDALDIANCCEAMGMRLADVGRF